MAVGAHLQRRPSSRLPLLRSRVCRVKRKLARRLRLLLPPPMGFLSSRLSLGRVRVPEGCRASDKERGAEEVQDPRGSPFETLNADDVPASLLLSATDDDCLY